MTAATEAAKRLIDLIDGMYVGADLNPFFKEWSEVDFRNTLGAAVGIIELLMQDFDRDAFLNDLAGAFGFDRN